MRKLGTVLLALLVILSFVSVSCTRAATGGSAADFFSKNLVTLSVNGAAGGTTDIAARLFAKYWQQVVGGPGMQVIDRSGGGGEEGLDFIHSAAPDGLNIGTTKLAADVLSPYVTGTGGVGFDASTLNYIGEMAFTPGIFVVGVDRPYKTIADLQAAKGIRFGTTSAGSAYQLAEAFIMDTLKLNGNITTGYLATEQALACKRGELDGYAGSSANVIADVKNGYVKSWFSMTVNQCAWTPDAPPFSKVAQLTADQTKTLQTIEALENSCGYYAPPNLPADKLDFFRRTFDKIVAMPEFLTEIKPTYPYWDPPMTGEQTTAQVKQVLSGPQGDPAYKALIAKYAAALTK